MSGKYRPRVVDASVKDVLSYSGGVLLEGVRACGVQSWFTASEVALDAGTPQIQAALELEDPVAHLGR